MTSDLVSANFNRYPSGGDRPNVEDYLTQYYQIFQNIVNDQEVTEIEVRASISRLVDPVAFVGGHEQEVHELESSLEQLLEGESSKPIRITTIIRKEGRESGWIRPSKDAVLWTSLSVGHESETFETVTVTEESVAKSLEDYQTKLEQILENPSENDKISIYLDSTEDGLFEFGIKTGD